MDTYACALLAFMYVCVQSMWHRLPCLAGSFENARALAHHVHRACTQLSTNMGADLCWQNTCAHAHTSAQTNCPLIIYTLPLRASSDRSSTELKQSSTGIHFAAYSWYGTVYKCKCIQVRCKDCTIRADGPTLVHCNCLNLVCAWQYIAQFALTLCLFAQK